MSMVKNFCAKVKSYTEVVVDTLKLIAMMTAVGMLTCFVGIFVIALALNVLSRF